jgi:hypothetical protein
MPTKSEATERSVTTYVKTLALPVLLDRLLWNDMARPPVYSMRLTGLFRPLLIFFEQRVG